MLDRPNCTEQNEVTVGVPTVTNIMRFNINIGYIDMIVNCHFSSNQWMAASKKHSGLYNLKRSDSFDTTDIDNRYSSFIRVVSKHDRP